MTEQAQNDKPAWNDKGKKLSFCEAALPLSF